MATLHNVTITPIITTFSATNPTSTSTSTANATGFFSEHIPTYDLHESIESPRSEACFTTAPRPNITSTTSLFSQLLKLTASFEPNTYPVLTAHIPLYPTSFKYALYPPPCDTCEAMYFEMEIGGEHMVRWRCGVDDEWRGEMDFCFRVPGTRGGATSQWTSATAAADIKVEDPDTTTTTTETKTSSNTRKRTAKTLEKELFSLHAKPIEIKAYRARKALDLGVNPVFWDYFDPRYFMVDRPPVPYVVFRFIYEDASNGTEFMEFASLSAEGGEEGEVEQAAEDGIRGSSGSSEQSTGTVVKRDPSAKRERVDSISPVVKGEPDEQRNPYEVPEVKVKRE
ncbi:uncharacterized protein PADG_00823 [Paracoccidioides brasiliensis Pb18]|uniref:Uncharacterized protein n=1 Tax=Paracoccidioides brasiliensis (strain Pb18) TaxID=502780 RepID=C1FYE7_PARBD|nr:uncharacterized protein PADG_00823 [Paracoccidioides brasiliensis Pb18]EEH44534.1 hypothetical protein PADG_00823 [Paracoccidioides brasiliensis Pb18]